MNGENFIETPKIRLKIVRFGIMAALLAGMPFFQNCSNVGFENAADSSNGANGGGNGGDASGNLTQNACQNQLLASSTLPLKVLIIVDNSGSNVGDSTYPGTDPAKTARAGSIQQFFTDYKAKTNFSWGLISFQGTAATALVNSPMFTSNINVMQGGISAFANTVTNPNDHTPYKAALQMAASAISSDTGSADTKYIIVFLSDGMPTDYPDSSAGDSQIYSDVASLIALRPGQVSFNSVYYGFSDASASGRLHNMALTGHGQFLDLNANPNARDFLIKSVVTVPGSTCN